MTEYCTASCADAENFCRSKWTTWWDAARCHADDNEDEIKETQENFDGGPEHPRDTIVVAVGIARKPKPLSEMVHAREARDLILNITDNDEDYLIERAELFRPTRDFHRDPELAAELKELAADIADALAKFERKPGMAADWFMVEDATEMTLGFAEQCAKCAALINMTGKLDGNAECKSLWMKVSTITEGSGGREQWTNLDLWQAAEFCGISAPIKPKGWKL
jgi:hypothetical protein